MEYPKNSRNKPLSVGMELCLTFASDLALLGICLLVFALFHHVLPKSLDPQDVTSDPSFTSLDIPGGKTSADTSSETDLTPEEIVAAEKHYKESPLPQRIVTELPGYQSDDLQIFLRKVEYGEGDAKVTYFAADVFVSSVEMIRGALAKKDGMLSTGYVDELAAENNALFAVSGDYFKNSEIGFVVRDGVQYRSVETKNDICLLYQDGTMECVSGKGFDPLKAIRNGVWQAWSFGPSLLTEEGEVKTKNSQFSIHGGGTYHNTNEESVNGVYSKHPRNFIGCVEPGHYIFVTVDGRDDGYSCGVTFIDESQIAYDEGCTVAYNLDGGRSAMMVFADERVNESYKDGRPISDIIYIAKEAASEEDDASEDAQK